MNEKLKTEADVVVLGGGIFGLASAYFLCRFGKKVILIEKKDVGSGASGSNEAWVWLSSRKQAVLPFARLSQQFYANFEETFGMDVEYNNCGGYIVAESEEEMKLFKPWVQGRWNEGMIEMQLLDAADFHARLPQVSKHVVGATWNPLDGCVNSILVCVALKDAIKAQGGEVWTQTDVTAINLKGNRVHEVECSRGTIRTDVVVNATGSWAAQIGKLVNVDIPILPNRMTVLVSEPIAPFMDTVMMSATYVFEELAKAKKLEAIEAGEVEELEAGYVYTQLRKGNLLLGSTEDFVGYDNLVNFECPVAIAKCINDLTPPLRNKKVNIIRSFANFFPYTKDDLPVMGAVPGVEGFVMASGLNGGGMALGLGCGFTIAQQVAFRDSMIPIEAFSITRKSLY